MFPVASRQSHKECQLFQLIGDVFALFPRINESLSVSMVLMYFLILTNISHLKFTAHDAQSVRIVFVPSQCLCS